MYSNTQAQQLAAEQRYVDALVALVKQNGSVSLPECVQFLTAHLETQGDWALYLPGYENILLWHGMSEARCTLLGDFIKHAHVNPVPAMTDTEYLMYLSTCTAGYGVLGIPLAKQLRHYKTEHFLPLLLEYKD